MSAALDALEDALRAMPLNPEPSPEAIRQVACEKGGALYVHAENETCDVCAARVDARSVPAPPDMIRVGGGTWCCQGCGQEFDMSEGHTPFGAECRGSSREDET